jgi:hypothetical protein
VGATTAVAGFFEVAVGRVDGVTRRATAGGRDAIGAPDDAVTPVMTEETASHATDVAAAVPTIQVPRAIDRRTE